MKKLFIPLVMLSLSACEKGNPTDAFDLNATFDFAVTSSDGIDLLNPEMLDAYKENEIKLYYLDEGKVVEIFDVNMASPRNFFIYGPEGNPGIDNYYIRIFLNYDKEEEYPTTIVKWNNKDEDVIKASFHYTDNAVILKEVWLNEELIWERGEQRYEIIK